jgi:hypothetical protein
LRIFENNITKLLFEAFGFMLKLMNELDEVWAQMLNQASAKAQISGNRDVAEYLALKASNDSIRQASVKWLFDCLLEIAAFENRNAANITNETENAHRFSFGNANLVGSRLDFRQGVRCLTLEAGWTRTPSDGFMRGGALACAKISHFGISKHNAELLLLRNEDMPNWFSVDKDGNRNLFNAVHLQRHFQVFLGTI